MRLKLHIIAEPLSFGTGPTNVATATRMAARGTPVARIAEHRAPSPRTSWRTARGR
jgi:hypothetical protein